MSFACTRINKWKCNVFNNGEIWNKIEILENETNILCTNTRFTTGSETVNFFTV